MSAIAFDGRDLGRNVIDALTALKRTPGCIQIPDITKPAFNVKTFQTFVVVLMSQQDPDPHAVVEQTMHEIGAYVSGRTGHENGRRRRVGRRVQP